MIRTTWKLKAGVKLPFAPADDTNTLSEQNVLLQPDSTRETGHKSASDLQVKALRQESCDLYIEKSADIAYLSSLCTFLGSKGISIAPFNDAFAYKSTDVVLIAAPRSDLKCKTFVMTADKAPLWEFLKHTFADRL